MFENRNLDVPETDRCPDTQKSVIAIKYTAKGTLFDNRVDCFVLETGKRLVSEARPPADENSTAWNAAFAAVAREHAMALDVDRVVIRCVELTRIVEALEDICWQETFNTPPYRGAWRLLHALAHTGQEALAAEVANTIHATPVATA